MDDIPHEAKAKLRIVLIDSIDEAIREALQPQAREAVGAGV